MPSKNNIHLLILFLAPLILMIPTMADVNYPPGGEYSDIAITHYPNFEFIKHSIQVDHQIPLWNPMILSGHPFAGDPLSGLFYPPGWLSFLFPLPMGINIVIYLHIVAGALGLYYLLRKIEVRESVALVISIGFGLMPKIFAHYGAGHATLIYAVCLTPGLMVTAAVRKTNNSGLNPFSILIFTLIILADLRWVPFALLGWIIMPLILIPDKRSDKSGILTTLGRIYREWLRDFQSIFFEVLLCILIASPLIFPFVEYFFHTTRVRMTAGENLIYSLPANRLIGLLIPPEGGFSEWVIYPGIGLILFLGLSFVTRRWKIILLSTTFLVCLLWSLGDQIPLVGLLSSMPVFNIIRVPTRIMFLGEILLLLSAGMTMEWVLTLADTSNIKKMAQLLSTAIFVFIILIAVGIGILQDSVLHSIIRMIVFVAFSYLCFLFLVRVKNPRIPLILFGCILVIDLLLSSFTLFSKKTMGKASDNILISTISDTYGLFRVYSPDYAIPQELAMKAQIPLAQGVNPMHLFEYVKYMEQASGIPYVRYGVIVPPLLDPVDAQTMNNQPDSVLMGLLNVRYQLSGYPINNISGWILLAQGDDLWLYKNNDELPRVYMIQEEQVCEQCSAIIDYYSPNKISIQADSGGMLILSELDYPGWRAWVDGVETQIIPYRSIFRMIKLKDGSHSVVFKYQPVSLFMGLLISGIIILTIFSPWSIKK